VTNTPAGRVDVTAAAFGAREHGELVAVGFEGDGSPSAALIGPGADPGDSGVVEVGEGVEERHGAEVERVIVREGDSVDPEESEDIERRGWGAEEERLARVRPG